MKIAAIYDIHGNLPALEGVLKEVRGEKVDRLVVGGDVVPGPMPVETLDLLLSIDIPTQFIMGNGDREVLAQMNGRETEWFSKTPDQWREPVRWSAQQLSAEHRSTISGWPATHTVDIREIGQILFCHATQRNDTDVFTRLTPDERLIPAFEGIVADVVVCGHTHMQFDRRMGSTRIVNAGSVGMPYGESGAYWLLIGSDIQLRRTKYDLELAADRIRRSSYPQAADFANNHVRNPPTEAAILEIFQRVELK